MHRLLAVVPLSLLATALLGQQPKGFTHADSLRHLVTPERAWWDVTFYDLNVKVHPADSSLVGSNVISYRVTGPAKEMQIDLQVPMVVDSMVQGARRLRFRRDGNAFFVTLIAPQRIGERKSVAVYYHGKPKPAINPPWDGGFTWVRDSLARPWIVTSNQGIGASLWWPNKDIGSDEPDSQRIAITVPHPMIDVSNGRLRKVTANPDSSTTWEWFVANPINNYDVAVSAGQYAHFGDTFQGERGPLTLDFYPLSYHLEAARKTFPQAVTMLQCFEHWFGPYPWYEDGYKLVESPHNGMEHQSAVAYGNGYANGYKGRDVSGTGLGMKFDFIIVHESAHEWFGNSITAKVIGDGWVQEGFASYAEGLYAECLFGKKAGEDYLVGTWRGIKNDAPVRGKFGGSGDGYNKGNALLHTLRQVISNDEKWRGILRGLSRTFYHQTVTSEQVEEYIARESGLDLSRVFEQYLKTTMVPVLEYRLTGTTLAYRWSNVVQGFAMPIALTTADSSYTVVRPTSEWQTVAVRLSGPAAFRVDRNYYVRSRDVGASPGPTPPGRPVSKTSRTIRRTGQQ